MIWFSLMLRWEWWCSVTVCILTEWVSSVFNICHFTTLHLMSLLRSLVPMGFFFLWRFLFLFSLDSLRISLLVSDSLKFCYNVLMFLFSLVWCSGTLSTYGALSVLGTELHSASDISFCFYFSLISDSCYPSVGIPTSILHCAYVSFTHTSLLLCGKILQTGL